MNENLNLIQKFMDWEEIPITEDWWTWIMLVIEKIENIDIEDWFYKWDSEDEVEYNYNGLNFEITTKGSFIWFEYQLDPPDIQFSSYDKDKKIATLKCIIKFIEWYNEKLNNYEMAIV